MFIMLYKVNLTFESVDKILKLYQSMNATEQLLSCGTVFCTVKRTLYVVTATCKCSSLAGPFK